MAELLTSPAFLMVVGFGWASVFLFTMNEALQGAAKQKIAGVLGGLIFVSIIMGFVLLGWRGFWSAAAIIVGGMVVAPFGYGAGQVLLRRLRGQ